MKDMDVHSCKRLGMGELASKQTKPLASDARDEGLIYDGQGVSGTAGKVDAMPGDTGTTTPSCYYSIDIIHGRACFGGAGIARVVRQVMDPGDNSTDPV